MSLADDEWGKPFFPTRFGEATGHANERILLDLVGGTGGIRTRVQEDADGTTTILKTRGGMPVFMTTSEQVVIQPVETPTEVIYCVGAPVSYSHRSGYMDTTTFTPMGTPIAEESPGSAKITVGDGATTFDYNRMVSTKWGSGSVKEHPGNRHWKWKAKNKVVSWWSPCPLSGSFTGSGYAYTQQLLGGTQQAKTDSYGNYTETFSAWVHNRSAIYIDGERVAIIPEDIRWVYAAAAKEIIVGSSMQTVLLVLMSATGPKSRFELPDGQLRLMSYNLTTGVFNSAVGISAYTSYSNSPFIPNFAFNESASKVAYVANKYSSESLQTEAHLFEMDTTSGAESVVRRITVPTPETRLWMPTLSLSGQSDAWDAVSSSNSDTVSQDKLRGFYYVGDTLNYAKLTTNRTFTRTAGSYLEVSYGYDDSGEGGSRHAGLAYYTLGGPMNGLSYSLTCTTQASIGGTVIGSYTTTHAAQATGTVGGEVHVPIRAGAYNFDSPVSGSSSFTVSDSGKRIDFAVVTDEGVAVVIEANGAVNYTQTRTASRPAFGSMTSSVSSSGSNSAYVASTAYIRFASGLKLDLPNGGDTYYSWQPLMTPGGGEYVYHGGISLNYAKTSGIASIAALKQISGEWQPTWTFTGAYSPTGAYSITPAWPGSFAYIESPIFIG